MENLRSGMQTLDQPFLKGFNLDRALFLLFLSSIMYERNEKQVVLDEVRRHPRSI